MLQQTQVKTVVPYWKRWMRELSKIENLAAAPQEKIHKLWEGLGYYSRVRNMQIAAQSLMQDHHGEFPRQFDDILALPGIGPYTAGAICSIAFNQPLPILDGNVVRVLTRVFGIIECPKERETNQKLWRLAAELVTHASQLKRYKSPCSHLNQSLMELGALVCTPRAPHCDSCPARILCQARKQNLQNDLPNLGKRPASTHRRFAAYVCERHGKFLVRLRPAGVVNAHLWEFPNIEIASTSGVKTRQRGKTTPLEPELKHKTKPTTKTAPSHPICTINHSITRYRITLEAFRANASESAKFARQGGTWLDLSELNRLSFPSAHKKILKALAEEIG